MSISSKIGAARKAGIWLFSRKPGLLIIHNGRAGSTVVQRLLEKNPAFSVFHEPWQDVPISRWAVLKDRMKAGAKRCSLDIKFHDFRRICPKGSGANARQIFESLGYTKFCSLWRENYLHWAVSIRRAQISRQWHNPSSGRSRNLEFTLPLGKFESKIGDYSLVDTFAELDRQKALLKEVISTDGLTLSYEKHVADDPNNAADLICRFVGEDFERQSAPLQRTRTVPARNELTNWEEVRRELEGTRWEWMLGDDRA